MEGCTVADAELAADGTVVYTCWACSRPHSEVSVVKQMSDSANHMIAAWCCSEHPIIGSVYQHGSLRLAFVLAALLSTKVHSLVRTNAYTARVVRVHRARGGAVYRVAAVSGRALRACAKTVVEFHPTFQCAFVGTFCTPTAVYVVGEGTAATLCCATAEWDYSHARPYATVSFMFGDEALHYLSSC